MATTEILAKKTMQLQSNNTMIKVPDHDISNIVDNSTSNQYDGLSPNPQGRDIPDINNGNPIKLSYRLFTNIYL